jgi:hypothetical protein
VQFVQCCAAMLIKAGHDPSLPLHTYRGEVLYMRMRLLGEGAHLEPSLSGGFVRLQEEASTHTLQRRELPQRLPRGLTALSYTKDHLMWHGDRLLLRTGRRLLAILEPDSEWPGMWRVRLPNGDLPDMANRTRAKDAAELLALASLKSAEAVEAA